MNLRLRLDAMRSAITTSARTRSAVSVLAQNTIGRAMRQMHSGIWQSLTRNRRLIPGGLGDRHPHASALTGRTELSFAAAAVAGKNRTGQKVLALQGMWIKFSRVHAREIRLTCADICF